MARITKIERGGYRNHTVHDPVETTLSYVFEIGGVTYAQFDSYGRSTRELLKSAFPDLK
jgi:hypothetical protein